MSEITGNRKSRRARKWTEAQARAALQAWRKSGQSIEQFAKGMNVSGQRVGYWKKRLGEKSQVAFVPIHTEPETLTAPLGHIEIEHGSVVLRVRESLDVEHVARLVDALTRKSRVAC